MKKIIFLSSGLKDELYEYFQNLGYNIEKIEKNDLTYDSISKHPDIFLFSTGDRLIVDPSLYLKYYNKYGDIVIKGEKSVGKKYPENIYYNVAKIGEFAIHKREFTDKNIIENLDVKWIDVKQGYSKCNILIVDDNSIITSDKGIYKSLIKEGVECLLIQSGYIKLEGLDCGFIGGTGVRVDEKIIFYGNIKKHPDYIIIKEFIELRNMKIVDFNFELEDIGSMIKLEME